MSVPVIVDANFDVSGAGASQHNANRFGPITFNNALYFPLVDFVNTHTLRMFKSTDGSATWVQVGATVTARQFAATWDGVSKITCAFNNDIGTSNVAWDLVDFDLNTETWGAPYGNSGALTSIELMSIGTRPDGSLILFYLNQTSVPVKKWLKAAAYSAGWSAEINASNQGQLDTGSSHHWESEACGFVIEPSSGITHAFYTWIDDASNTRYYYHQNINADNSLGTAFQFSQVGFPDMVVTGAAGDIGTPVLSEAHNWILFPVYTTSVGSPTTADGFGFFQSSDLTGSNWTLTVLPNGSVVSPTETPNAMFTGTALYLALIDFAQGFYQIATASVANPSAATFTQTLILNDPSLVSVNQVRVSDAVGYVGNILFSSDSTGFSSAYSFLFSAPPVPPAPPSGSTVQPVYLTIGGGSSGASQGPIALPDLHVRCDVNGRKRCYFVPKGFGK
jgi:hypothetical protein